MIPDEESIKDRACNCDFHTSQKKHCRLHNRRHPFIRKSHLAVSSSSLPLEVLTCTCCSPCQMRSFNKSAACSSNTMCQYCTMLKCFPRTDVELCQPSADNGLVRQKGTQKQLWIRLNTGFYTYYMTCD